MTRDEWDPASGAGRRWAYYDSMSTGAREDSPIVRIVRWYKSGVRVHFTDGRVELVHPEHLYLSPAA